MVYTFLRAPCGADAAHGAHHRHPAPIVGVAERVHQMVPLVATVLLARLLVYGAHPVSLDEHGLAWQTFLVQARSLPAFLVAAVSACWDLMLLAAVAAQCTPWTIGVSWLLP